MNSSGKINALGEQYIGAEGPQIASWGNANVMAWSIQTTISLALIVSIAEFASF